MFISCPKCETTFSLPDELYKPGKKARCSQCGNVFSMPGPSPDDSPIDPAPGFGETAPPSSKTSGHAPKKFFSAVIALIAAVLVVTLAYGAFLMYRSIPAVPETPPTANGTATAPEEAVAQAEHEKLINSISLDEIRQFLVDNVLIGKIMVIQGLAVNMSDGNRDFITLEARILDGNNRVLARVRQSCGVPLTLFQLQSLSEQELKESLDNRITILTNNANVPPGGKVPFVVIFPNPPEGMRTFEVRVIDVRVSPPQ